MSIAELKKIIPPQQWQGIMDQIDEDYCNGYQGTEIFFNGLKYLLPLVNVTLKNPEV